MKTPAKPYKRYLTKYAQKLRKAMTPQEKHLWYDFLRTYPLQFRRQSPAGKYVLDFYCHQARLAIEIDGTQHYEPKDKFADAERTAALRQLGITVIRFDNIQIERYFATVCEEIDRIIKEQLTTAERTT